MRLIDDDLATSLAPGGRLDTLLSAVDFATSPQVDSGGELLFGTQLGYGWGEMLAPDVYAAPSDWSVVKTQSFSALFVLAGNTMLRPLVNAINRSPLDERASEATYHFKLAVTPHALPGMRDRLVERLDREVSILQGEGSRLHARPLGEGWAEVGGRVALDEIRDY